MNDDRSLERTARAWLEMGPTRAPDRPVEAALTIIERTPQERAWPRPLGGLRVRFSDRALMAAAVLVAALAGGVALVGGVTVFRIDLGPAPVISPSPSPSSSVVPSDSALPAASATDVAPPVLTATFRSPRNGFALTYPGDWTVTPATARWESGALNLWESAAIDELQGATVRFAGTSQPLAEGQTAEDWLNAYAPAACVGPRETWATVPIGSAIGYITADGCEVPDPPIAKGGRLFDAVVVVGGRAYNFTMDGELTPSDFVAVLAAITLDPATAVDASPQP
jgi:hypothetical protein